MPVGAPGMPSGTSRPRPPGGADRTECARADPGWPVDRSGGGGGRLWRASGVVMAITVHQYSSSEKKARERESGKIECGTSVPCVTHAPGRARQSSPDSLHGGRLATAEKIPCDSLTGLAGTRPHQPPDLGRQLRRREEVAPPAGPADARAQPTQRRTPAHACAHRDPERRAPHREGAEQQ